MDKEQQMTPFLQMDNSYCPLVRLSGCKSWSESSVGAYVIVFNRSNFLHLLFVLYF